MKLVIVESPSKTKTIKQYLGSDFNVVATKGHIRDIANVGLDNLGIDFKNGYKPIYAIIPKQYPTIKMLNEEVGKADYVYLATDPDREGEAISWHLKEVLNFKNKSVKRIEFNEITEPAIKEALEHPRDIDDSLFESQETRKLIDRIIGFKLSTLLKQEVGSSTAGSKVSAGRVQSVALKLITDREEAIKAFVPVIHYEVEVDNKDYKLKLQDPSKPNSVWSFDKEEDAIKIVEKLSNIYKVYNINNSKRYEKAQPPFTTSTLIQAALNKYSLSSTRTMMIAQGLYEGIDVNNKHLAFITYMRTDSTRMSEVFKKQLVGHIISNYGKEYLGYEHTKNNNENIQDAHEAIRPVSLERTPESVKEYLSKEQYLVYSLIYQQTVESMMKDSIIDVKTVSFINNSYIFNTSFESVSFKGFKIDREVEKSENQAFLKNIDDEIKINKKPEILRKESEGPKRFTEATLIKEMESYGIGRPSTYASTMSTLKTKEYVSIQKKKMVPTDQGTITSNFLHEYFPEIINIDYTANMEKTLDEIALGEKEESVIVPQFYNAFVKLYDERKNSMKPMETGEVCPICGSKMVYKTNKFGRFEACSNYPTCKYIKKEVKEDIPLIACPSCHTGHLVEKKAMKGKYKGKKFYGCSNYPDCTFITSSLSNIKKVQ